MSQPPLSGNLLAKNTSWNLLGQMLPLLAGVLAVPYVIHGLGTDAFGVLSLAWVVLGYFNLFDVGLGRATTKFVAERLGRKESEQLPDLVWTSLGLQLLFGTLGGSVLAGLSSLIAERVIQTPPALLEETRLIFLLLAASLPLILGTVTLRGVLEAHQRFDLTNAVKIPASTSTFLIPALGVWLSLPLPGIVGLLVLAKLAAALAYLLLCFHILPNLRLRPRMHGQLVRPLLTFGSWVTVSSVVGPLLVYMDRVLIGARLSMAGVTYYTAPYQLATLFWILPGSLATVLFPAFGRAAGERTQLGELYARSLKALGLSLGPALLLVMFYAEDILRVWLGTDFAARSSAPLQILALGVLINSLAFVPYSLLQATGRPDLTAKFHLLELPFYGACLWILMDKMGIVGAALAWVLRVTLDAVLVFGACSVSTRVPSGTLVRSGLARTVVVLVVFGLSLSFASRVDGMPVVQALLALGLIVLFVRATWRYALDQIDRSFLTSTINQLTAAVWGQR